MAFRPTDPDNTDVAEQVYQTRVLDTYHIHGIQITKEPNSLESLSVNLTWSKGYTLDGIYRPVTHFTTVASSEQLEEALNVLGEPIRAMAWKLIANIERLSGDVAK